MKSFIAATAFLAGSAHAFAPVATGPAQTSLKATVFEEMPGAVNFLGKKMEFDPLGFSETYAPWRGFFREAELRHARTAMLAVTGWIVADFVRIPGEAYSFANVPSSFEAHNTLLEGPMHQLLLWISLFDIVITYPAIQAMNAGERAPGDFYFGKSFAPKTEDGMLKMQEKELLNGRLAMIAIGGIATHAAISGHSFPYL